MLKVDRGQHFANRFCTDVGLERICTKGVLRIHELLFGHQLTISQVREAGLNHDVVLKVENTLKIAQGHVQHQADARWQRLEEPNVCNGRRQFDVAHPLTADLLQRDFNTTFFADNAAIFHTLIFAAQTFVIFDRAKDTRAEQAITLGLECPVVDGFRLFDLTIRPRQDALRRCERHLDFVEHFGGRDGVEWVVCKFLVHFDTSMGVEGKRGGTAGTSPAQCAAYSAAIPPSSSSASRSSMFRPRPRTSFTRTLKLSGTPASKLSSPFTMLS